MRRPKDRVRQLPSDQETLVEEPLVLQRETEEDNDTVESANLILDEAIGDNGKRLRSLGFFRASDARSHEIQEQSKRIVSLAKTFHQKFPGHVFAVASLIHGLILKHNLVLVPVDGFTGSVPEENISVIEHFVTKGLMEEQNDYLRKHSSLVVLCSPSMVDSTRYDLKGTEQMEYTSDPIVLLCIHKEYTMLNEEVYLCITSWGTDAGG